MSRHAPPVPDALLAAANAGDTAEAVYLAGEDGYERGFQAGRRVGRSEMLREMMGSMMEPIAEAVRASLLDTPGPGDGAVTPEPVAASINSEAHAA